MSKGEPIFLSKAHVTDLEVQAVTRAVTSGWVTPLGPQVDAFEQEISEFVGVNNAVALSSGTAALHLGLKALGVQPGDEVLVPTLTFAATAFAVVHAQASPVFLDSERQSWNLDPQLLAEVLHAKAEQSRLPAAVIPVDLFGRTADYDSILSVCAEYDVPVLVDAAESLGAVHHGEPAGSMGAAAVFSFNGNKIMTTAGGGMLVSNDPEIVDKARYWSTQSREALPWYEHHEIGYNYRMSNILAALGQAQLERLPEMIARRTEIQELYRTQLADVEGVTVQSDPPWGQGNHWLTTVTLDPQIVTNSSLTIQKALAEESIEVRPVWKPMHQQPVFADSESHLTGVADEVFATGMCLPSGFSLTDDDVLRVVTALKGAL